MTKLDASLLNIKSLRAEGRPRMEQLADAPFEPVYFAPQQAVDDDPLVSVIVRFYGSLDPLEAAGFVPDTIAGNIATGSIRVSALDDLDHVAALETAEAAHSVKAFVDLSVPEIRADQVHTGPPGFRGTNVVVGIVDSGIDYTHDNFRAPTGGTRISNIWDQNLTPQGGEANPTGFTYGVEYNRTAIDGALAAANPFAVVRHQDQDALDNHGTHVAGIAAGDGSLAGNGRAADTFVGAAPEATIVAVATDFSTTGVIDGVNYVFRTAQALGRPAVVNLSLGSVIGPHDGTSNFEQGLMNLVTGSGRVVVVAAGNEASDAAHASPTIVAGGTTTLTINVPTNRRAAVVLDLWYEGADTFGVSLIAPGGAGSGNVAVGARFNANLGGTNSVVDHRNNDPVNGDKRVTVIINPVLGGDVPAGAWQLQLVGTTVSSGRADAWLNNPGGEPRAQFPAGQATANGTLAVPATANNVISVGSYITRGAGTGGLSTFSNRGPTRDARAAPTIAAPGQRIISANRVAVAPYQTLSGTSMACPHVTGVAALMLQKESTLTWSQVRDCLQSTARSDSFTGATPNTAWGAGKVDALAAVNCVGSVAIPVLPTRLVCPTRAVLCISTRTVDCFRTRTVDCFRTRTVDCFRTRTVDCFRTRAGCPTPTRACTLPFNRAAYGPSIGRLPQSPRVEDLWQEQLEAAYQQGYQDAYRQGYQDAYSEAYGTCEECGSPPAHRSTYYEYDESWFNSGEFE